MRRDRRFRPGLDSLEDRLPLDGDTGTDPFEDPFAPPIDSSGPDSTAPGYLADNPFAPPVDSDPDSAGDLPRDSTDPFEDPFAPPIDSSGPDSTAPTPD